MTEYTRPATWADLIALGRELNLRGARYALIGGPDNTRKWVDALATLPDAAALELQGDPEIFEREGTYAIRINDVITVDVMAAACGHSWQELSKHIVEIEVEAVRLKVLSLEGLLLTKEGMRDKDRADRAVLLRALGRSE